MQLSEPQKRVLRTMVQYGPHIRINQYGNIRYGAFQGRLLPYEARRFPPLKRTVLALQRKGLIDSKEYDHWDSGVFILTPKGREIAEELQNAEANV